MSGRTDDVAALRKWQDRIRKEMRFTEAREVGEFHINPHSLKPLTAKIGEAEKAVASAEATARREKDVADVKAILTATHRPPQEKAKRPATVSQEIGWHWKEAEVPPARAVHAASPEVAYATVYYETFHCGPFAKTQSVAR